MINAFHNKLIKFVSIYAENEPKIERKNVGTKKAAWSLNEIFDGALKIKGQVIFGRLEEKRWLIKANLLQALNI
jgi:hypothetical protein